MGDLLFDSDFKLAATTVESLTILGGRFVDLRSVSWSLMSFIPPLVRSAQARYCLATARLVSTTIPSAARSDAHAARISQDPPMAAGTPYPNAEKSYT